MSTPTQCNLLALPAELRNAIYALLFSMPTGSHPRTIAARVVYPQVFTNDWHRVVHTQILRTCRQIHTEATPLLYALNIFTASPTLLTSMPRLLHLRPIFSPANRHHIKKWYIKLRIDCDPQFNEADVMGAFSGAGELEVEATESMFRAAGTGTLMLFKNVRGVGKAIVHGSVDKSFATWLEGAMMSKPGTKLEDVSDEVMQRCNVWSHLNKT